MASSKSPIHPQALTFDELNTGGLHEVVVLACEDEGFTVCSFGRMGRDDRCFGYDEDYGTGTADSLIDELDAERLGLLPRHYHPENSGWCPPLQQPPSDDLLRDNGQVRDPLDEWVAWTRRIVVSRSVAHEVIGCTEEELAGLLAECASTILADWQRDAEEEEAYLREHEDEIWAAMNDDQQE